MKKLLLTLIITLSLTACGAQEAELPLNDADEATTSEAMETPENEPGDNMATSEVMELPEGEEKPEVVQKANEEPAIIVEGKSANALTIETGSVTYSVQKAWLKKPAQTVNGTTTAITGSGTLEDGKLSLNAEVNAKNFDSGSGGRDNHVAGMFTGNVKVAGSNIDIKSTSAKLDITINGVTQSIPFILSIKDEGDVIAATGNGSLSLESFGLEAPSIADLYTVEDIVKMSFSITASK